MACSPLWIKWTNILRLHSSTYPRRILKLLHTILCYPMHGSYNNEVFLSFILLKIHLRTPRHLYLICFLFNHNVCMPEMTLRTFSFRPDDIQAPFKKIFEILTFVMLPIPSYECFEFREEFPDRVQVGRVRWHVQQLDTSI